MTTYTDLNAQLNMPVDGAINIRADKDAARAYHLEVVNPHTRFFHSLEEKTRYMLENELWARDTVEMYDFEQFKDLFKRAYAYKYRFETLMGALKFYESYSLKEITKDEFGAYTTTYLERFEDRVVMTAIHLSQGDYQQAQDLIDIIIDGRFQPATPTFLNAGRAKGGEMVSCFEGSTPVLTEQGEVPIREIRIGDKVFGHDGKAHEVEAVHAHKATATVEIDVTGQPEKITSTLEHPYLTTAKLGHQEHVGDGDSENLKWKSAADILPGDFIAASVEDYSEHAVDKIDLKAYALDFWGDVVEHDGKYYRASVDRKSNKAKGHNRCLKSVAVNKEVHLNADFGYLVGLYLAEGYVHKYNGAVKGVRYTFNSNDQDVIDETVKIAARIFGVEPVVNINRDGSTNVAIWSGVAGHMFLDLFGTGFDTKRVPKIMRSADPDFLYSLACGIFRGDGCGYANGNIMELSNRELVRDVHNILHQLGVLSYTRDKITQSGNPSSSITVPRSNETNDQFLKSIGRGYEKITAEYSEMYAKWVDGRPVYRVRSVEQASPETVYNLQVAEVNTYVAGGLHVHNCFLLRMEDNLESIARTYASSMQLSKRGGGVGILLTNMREQGAPLKGIPGVGRGVVPIMKNLEDQFSHIDQLGQRQGAGAVYLNAHHPDIMTFLDTKRENADEKIRIKTLSLGVVIPDITFHLAKSNKDMYLFSPYDVEQVEGKPFSDVSVTENYDRWVEDDRISKTKIKARDFFRTLSELQFESGYPYVLFEDTANRHHPMKHIGKINLSNLCSEIAQVNSPSSMEDDLTYTEIGADISCNLGSLNVKKMLDLTRDEFVDTVQVAVRALTAVSVLTDIDAVPTVKKGNNLSRAIGLGQMNLHGALAHHGLRYGSEEALKLWDNYMALVTWAAMCESAELAREIGETPYFDGSEYATGEWWERVPKAHLERAESLEILPGLDAPDADDWNDLHLKISQYGMANAYLQTVPPTGSISYINNSTSSIHPIVNKVEIRKEGKLGRVYYPAPHMRSDNLHLYEDAYEIGPERIIDTYAVSQHWIDQSQSLTLFMKDTATTRDLDRARIYAWRKGVKSIYYIRLRQMALDGTGVTETGVAECESCLL